uniref:Uncharacterized protein n=1 Tax=Oryza rufipogon TaxID=4529 RepID=A0A0E0QBG9_ORYRU
MRTLYSIVPKPGPGGFHGWTGWWKLPVNHSLDTVAQTLSASGPRLRWVGHEPNGPAPLPPETGRAQAPR